MQVRSSVETPSLFDKDVFPRNTGIDLSNLFAKLDTIKKTVLDDDDYFKADADDENDIAILERDNNKSKKVGIFSLKSKSADVKVDLPDGDYKNSCGFKRKDSLQRQCNNYPQVK